jgi:5-methylcytosine-specific restriction protein A
MSDVYGDLGSGFIHVHHRVPLGDVRAEHDVDPIRDLIPVCPNCHSMLHRRNPPMKVEDLAAIVRARRLSAAKAGAN